MAVCYLGIGSNLGNRKKNIRSAVEKIGKLKGTRVIKLSKLITSEPVAAPKGSPHFLNGALKIETKLPPLALLKNLKKIEKALGRVKATRNSPRTIDLDILFYADRILKTKALIIPHPRVFEREFVLKPLFEIV